MSDDDLTLLVLGPPRIEGDTLRSRAHRHVLAWAALHHGRTVGLERCGRLLWPDLDAAAGSRKARDAARALAIRFPDTLSTDGDVVELSLPPSRLDEHAFRVRTAPGDGDEPSELARLTSALGLWRGTPYPGLHHLPAVQRRVGLLRELRLTAIERRFALLLGRDPGTPEVPVLAELFAATQTHPGRERLWRLLAVGLYRSSRQVEALAELEACRRQQRSRVEPGSSALDALQLAMLRADDEAVSSAM